MTRDTFDLFEDGKRERARFGDNESADSRVNASVKSDLVDLDLSYSSSTEKAVRVKGPGDWVWLPKSQIEFEMIDKGTVRVTLPSWLAREKGLM
jgi:hypothetical protein